MRVGGAIRLIKERYATDADLSQFASEIGESLEFVKEFLANKTKVTPQLAKRIAIALGIKIEDSEMTTNFRDFEEERQKRVQEEIDAFFLDNSYSDHNYILDENDNIIGETSKLQRKQSELSRLCQNFVQDPIATKELSVQMLDNKDIKKIRQGEKYLFKSTKCKLSNSYEVTKKGIIKLYKDLWEAIHGKNKQQEKQEHLF